MLLTEDNYTCSLPRDVQEIAQKELNETNKQRKKALADIRKWIKNQSHIRRTRLDSNFILRFLRMQKFDIKESCEILEKYLTMRGQYPAWFQNLDCRDPAISDLVSAGYIFVLPERDQHGRRVIFSQAAAFDSSKYTVSDLMRAHVMTFETLLNDEENQVRGFTYIFDEKDVSWSHLSIWTPSEVSKAFSCCERALPMRHKDIHFLNLPWTMNLIFQFAKSLLSGKIRNRFKTHSNVEHLPSFPWSTGAPSLSRSASRIGKLSWSSTEPLCWTWTCSKWTTLPSTNILESLGRSQGTTATVDLRCWA